MTMARLVKIMMPMISCDGCDLDDHHIIYMQGSEDKYYLGDWLGLLTGSTLANACPTAFPMNPVDLQTHTTYIFSHPAQHGTPRHGAHKYLR